MKDFKGYINEAEADNSALINYVGTNIYKLAVADDDNLKPLVLLLAATILASMDDAKATQMGRKIAQLATTVAKK